MASQYNNSILVCIACSRMYCMIWPASGCCAWVVHHTGLRCIAVPALLTMTLRLAAVWPCLQHALLWRFVCDVYAVMCCLSPILFAIFRSFWLQQRYDEFQTLCQSLGMFLRSCMTTLPEFVSPTLSNALQRMALVLSASLLMIVVINTIDNTWCHLYLAKTRHITG